MMTNQTVISSQSRPLLVPHKRGETQFFTRGTKPKLLILSGMHGDEFEVIDCVSDYIKTHRHELPDFLFIPRVSPSAVAQKTRKNQLKNDINRQFFDGTNDPEAQIIMEILKSYRFDLCTEFHEDPDRTAGFYLYDTGHLTDTQLAVYRQKIEDTGARLYTGIDDPYDAHLGLAVEKGYISTPAQKLPKEAGFSTRWFLSRGIVERAFTPEIPGKAPIELKQKLVEALFSFLPQLFKIGSLVQKT